MLYVEVNNSSVGIVCTKFQPPSTFTQTAVVSTKRTFKGKELQVTKCKMSIEMDILSDESEGEKQSFLDKKHKNGNVKEPLIKNQPSKVSKGVHTEIIPGDAKAKRCCGPFCCLFIICKFIMGIIALTIILINTHSKWLFPNFGAKIEKKYVGCEDLEITPIWQTKLPKLTTKGGTRMLHANEDDVLDVVIGFGINADKPNILCDMHSNDKKPCFGGIIALDGTSGAEIWRIWTKHKIFSLTCQSDIDNDGALDCLACGRSGVFIAISIKQGKKIWELDNPTTKLDIMSVYSPQVIMDIDNDQIDDIVVVHGGDFQSKKIEKKQSYGKLMLYSGKTGKLLQWVPTPDYKESFYPPQVTVTADGEQFILFGTGSIRLGGGFYAKPILDLYRKNVSTVKLIYEDQLRGFINPAALADLNSDGILDIILISMNEKILTFDGSNFQKIWSNSLKSLQSASSIGLGFFDNDDIPDIIVKYSYGDHSLTYKYENTIILSGKNGSTIKKINNNSITTLSSPISISLEGHGNDIFLHWSANCLDHKGEKINFRFKSNAQLYDKNLADVCQSLYGVGQFSRFLAISNRFHDEIEIYNSSFWNNFELPTFTTKNIHTIKKDEETTLKNVYSRRLLRGVSEQKATGLLAPSLIYTNDTIDVVILSNWLYPTKLVALQTKILNCVENELRKIEFERTNSMNQQNGTRKTSAIEKHCSNFEEKQVENEKKIEETSGNDIPMKIGQLTINRFSIRCICDKSHLKPNEKCARVLSYGKQRWPAYMGLYGDGKFGEVLTNHLSV